jgi:hypothetical protein
VYLNAPESASDPDQMAPSRPTPQLPELHSTAVISLYQSFLAKQENEIVFLREQLEQTFRELAAESERSKEIHREALNLIEVLAGARSH